MKDLITTESCHSQKTLDVRQQFNFVSKASQDDVQAVKALLGWLGGVGLRRNMNKSLITPTRGQANVVH